MPRVIISEENKKILKRYGVDIGLLESGKSEEFFKNLFQESVKKIKTNNTSGLESTIQDFYRGIEGTEVTMNNTQILAEEAKKHRPDDNNGGAKFIQERFDQLTNNKKFRDSIIANFNQGGLAASMMSAFHSVVENIIDDQNDSKAQGIANLGYELSFTENRKFSFKSDNNKVHFTNEFSIVGKDGKDERLVVHTAFDFVWDEGSKGESMSIENIQLKLTPKGKFRQYLQKEQKNEEKYELSRGIKWTAVGLFVISIVIAGLTLYQKNKNATIGLGALAFFIVIVSFISAFFEKKYKKEHNSCEQYNDSLGLDKHDRGCLKSGNVEQMSFDGQFYFFTEYCKDIAQGRDPLLNEQMDHVPNGISVTSVEGVTRHGHQKTE